ncbi:hypothetical protein ABG067_009589, partial [Albugo candida]
MKKKEVKGEDLVKDLSELVENNYDGKNLKLYKGDWKRKIKAIAKDMGYTLRDPDSDAFESLNFKKRADTTTSNKTTTSSNYKLSASEKKAIID